VENHLLCKNNCLNEWVHFKLGAIEDENNSQINIETLSQEMLSTAYWPIRKIIKLQLEKFLKGDFSAAGRMQYKMVQIGGLLTFLMGTLAVISVIILVIGINTY
jgi:hypothetical protein